jgi:hypothetical protein
VHPLPLKKFTSKKVCAYGCAAFIEISTEHTKIWWMRTLQNRFFTDLMPMMQVTLSFCYI